MLHQGAASSTNDATPQNPGKAPWQEELYRLASQRNHHQSLTTSPHLADALTKPVHPATYKPLANGTITNLKVWWGKSIAPYKPKDVDITTFAPAPKKHPNPWRQ